MQLNLWRAHGKIEIRNNMVTIKFPSVLHYYDGEVRIILEVRAKV